MKYRLLVLINTAIKMSLILHIESRMNNKEHKLIFGDKRFTKIYYIKNSTMKRVIKRKLDKYRKSNSSWYRCEKDKIISTINSVCEMDLVSDSKKVIDSELTMKNIVDDFKETGDKDKLARDISRFNKLNRRNPW